MTEARNLVKLNGNDNYLKGVRYQPINFPEQVKPGNLVDCPSICAQFH